MTEFTISNVEAFNLAKSSHPINTGIGFFDHMLDQLNSHAQIGVAVTVNGNSAASDAASSQDKNRHADGQLQESLMSQVGTALGEQIKQLLPTNGSRSGSCKSRFCCPLDEALVECILSTDDSGSAAGSLSFDLAPYGIFPKTGRTKIGQMMTAPLPSFFTSLASASGLNIRLKKVRGDNGHHIVKYLYTFLRRNMNRHLLNQR